MAVSNVPQQTAAPPPTAYEDTDRGYGWVLFAGTMLCLVGTLNMIEGIAAISNSKFFVANTTYIAGDLRAWGWTILIVGVCEILVGLGVFVKNQFARWLGVVVASLNAIAQLFFINARPFWALTLFALDILVVYGLVAYGSRTSRA